MFPIPLEKLKFIAELAREVDAKVAPWGAAGDDEGATAILADNAGDATSTKLGSFIEDMNDDEQASLVALVWIGRGTFEPDEFDTAVETAIEEKVNPTSVYLMGIPLLADYIEDGAEKLGLDLDAV